MHAEAKRSEAAAGTHLPNPQLEGPALCSAPSANMFYLRTGHERKVSGIAYVGCTIGSSAAWYGRDGRGSAQNTMHPALRCG